MNYIKKNDFLTVTYLVNNKINFFFGKVLKIKKFTLHIEKKNYGIIIKKIFFLKNPNLISLKLNN